jgi:N-acetylmuramic acid 6-phosphate (MurNAc-6-P) etherase
MVDVRTGSEKLKDRARRIIGIVTGLDYDEADKLLRRSRWNVKVAIVMQKASISYGDALKRLRKAEESIRDAIGEDIEPRMRQLLKLDKVERVESSAAAPSSSTSSTRR